MVGQKKKLYAGIMILCGAALVADQLIPMATETLPAIAVASTPSSAPLATPSAPLSIPELPFPRGLEPFDPRSDVPDLFAPPHFQSKDDPTAPSPDNSPAEVTAPIGPDEVSHTAFNARHTVEGVMIDQGLRIAVIDGELRQLGQKVDGCTLVNITDYEVRFECRDGVAALKIHEEELLPED